MRRFVVFLIVSLVTAAVPRSSPGQAPGQLEALIFDAAMKEEFVAAGTTNVNFIFAFTNASPGQVIIEGIRTSCGCTVARVPKLPWVVAPGEAGEIGVVLDLRGKFGVVTKSVFVTSSAGTKPLTIRAHSPGAPAGMAAMDDRERNLRVAMADRKAIFRGDCANCHSTPAAGKTGLALYQAACGICHDSHNRASMVPDLKNLPHPTDRDHWIKWATFGRHGSLMAPFAASEGGPLTDQQIDSLADYLAKAISEPRAAGPRLSQVPPLPPALPAVNR